ncbi:MAG: cysteine synthase A [bacterium]
MKIAKDVTELVGSTPLVRLNRVTRDCKATVVAKLEFYNPLSSVKDRIAVAMIDEAEKTGKLKKGATIIEPTSGNTGIALAFVCAARGYNLVITMPDVVSVERKMLLEAFGARVVLTPGVEGMSGAVRKAEQLISNTPNAFMPQQFSNMANLLAHRNTTAREIWEDTEGRVDVLVAGVGTGGTLCGIAQRLKEVKPSVRIVAVEPETCAVLSGRTPGPHRIQGIGAGFIPEIWRSHLTDEILLVSNKQAEHMTRQLVALEGLFVGVSSGAAAVAAISVASREENKDKLVVAIFPDTGERYLSTGIFST